MNSWGILLVGVAAPLIAGVYWKKANTAGAIASALSGTATWFFLSLWLPEGYPLQLFGFVISCIVLVAVSLGTYRAETSGVS